MAEEQVRLRRGGGTGCRVERTAWALTRGDPAWFIWEMPDHLEILRETSGFTEDQEGDIQGEQLTCRQRSRSVYWSESYFSDGCAYPGDLRRTCNRQHFLPQPTGMNE